MVAFTREYDTMFNIHKGKQAAAKNNRVDSPSKFFVVNDLKGYLPQNSIGLDGAAGGGPSDGSIMKNSDTKIKNQIRLAMEVRNPVLVI